MKEAQSDDGGRSSEKKADFSLQTGGYERLEVGESVS